MQSAESPDLEMWREEAIGRAWDGLLAYLSETPLQQTLRTHLSDYPTKSPGGKYFGPGVLRG